jgi:hypothetical protein
VIALVLVAAAIAANPTETIKLEPVGGAAVRGTATLGARGSGTHAVLAIRGLAANGTVRALLHAGTCRRPSASFASIGSASANAGGVARWGSAIRFRTDPVSWTSVADGAHVVAIVSGAKVVACGVIPGMN